MKLSLILQIKKLESQNNKLFWLKATQSGHPRCGLELSASIPAGRSFCCSPHCPSSSYLRFRPLPRRGRGWLCLEPLREEGFSMRTSKRWLPRAFADPQRWASALHINPIALPSVTSARQAVVVLGRAGEGCICAPPRLVSSGNLESPGIPFGDPLGISWA